MRMTKMTRRAMCRSGIIAMMILFNTTCKPENCQDDSKIVNNIVWSNWNASTNYQCNAWSCAALQMYFGLCWTVKTDEIFQNSIGMNILFEMIGYYSDWYWAECRASDYCSASQQSAEPKVSPGMTNRKPSQCIAENAAECNEENWKIAARM